MTKPRPCDNGTKAEAPNGFPLPLPSLGKLGNQDYGLVRASSLAVAGPCLEALTTVSVPRDVPLEAESTREELRAHRGVYLGTLGYPKAGPLPGQDFR